MATWGEDRVIRSLLTMPRMVTIRACIVSLPHILERDAKEEVYRVYVTDTLYSIAYNTAMCAQAINQSSRYCTKRYAEIVGTAVGGFPHTEDNRTSEEIIYSIKCKLSRIGGGDE